MNATDTPTPTSVRPAAAISHVGASANASEPEPGDERAGGQDAAAAPACRRARRPGSAAPCRRRNTSRRACPSTALLIANARVSSPAIAAGAVRWKNDSTKLASTMPKTTRRARTKRGSGGAAACGHAALYRRGRDGAAFGTMRVAGHRAAIASPMKYADLRDFLAQLERRGELKRIARRGRSAARDDRDLRPRAEGRRPGAAVRAAEGLRGAGGRTRCRCSAISSARRGASRSGWARSRSRRCAKSASCSRSSRSPSRRRA